MKNSKTKNKAPKLVFVNSSSDTMSLEGKAQKTWHGIQNGSVPGVAVMWDDIFLAVSGVLAANPARVIGAGLSLFSGYQLKKSGNGEDVFPQKLKEKVPPLQKVEDLFHKRPWECSRGISMTVSACFLTAGVFTEAMNPELSGVTEVLKASLGNPEVWYGAYGIFAKSFALLRETADPVNIASKTLDKFSPFLRKKESEDDLMHASLEVIGEPVTLSRKDKEINDDTLIHEFLDSLKKEESESDLNGAFKVLRNFSTLRESQDISNTETMDKFLTFLKEKGESVTLPEKDEKTNDAALVGEFLNSLANNKTGEDGLSDEFKKFADSDEKQNPTKKKGILSKTWNTIKKNGLKISSIVLTPAIILRTQTGISEMAKHAGDPTKYASGLTYMASIIPYGIFLATKWFSDKKVSGLNFEDAMDKREKEREIIRVDKNDIEAALTAAKVSEERQAKITEVFEKSGNYKPVASVLAKHLEKDELFKTLQTLNDVENNADEEAEKDGAIIKLQQLKEERLLKILLDTARQENGGRAAA